MADCVTIQQSLHGYAEGHRLIATSVSLPPGDAKTVLTLSDSSGSAGWNEESGYLTGYPLRESSLYALARTWRAKEMPRPGCVWTHTLFLDLSDLAKLRSLCDILPLFRRPTSASSFSEFGTTIEVQSTNFQPETALDPQGKAWCRRVIDGLYKFPQERIAIEQPAFDPEPLVIALWLQQWPRLRRSFSFCTATDMDRSTDRLRFDLQVAAKGRRGGSARFHNVQSVGTSWANEDESPWIDIALADLFVERNESLRAFLMHVGVEIPTGRAAFETLISFYRLLNEAESRADAILEALTLSKSMLLEPNSVGYRLLATKAIRHAGELPPAAHEFLLSQLAQLDQSDVLVNARGIGAATWAMSPPRFCALFESSEQEILVAKRAIEGMPSAIIISGLRSHPEIAGCILSHRPEITAVPDFWKDEGLDDHGLAVLAERPGLGPDAIAAMIKGGVVRLAHRVVATLGSKSIWIVLAPAMDEATGTQLYELEAWIRAVLSDRAGLAETLASGRIRVKKSLCLLARLVEPEYVPNEFGDDPWLLAANSAKGNVSTAESIFLSAYLMARALGKVSRSCADLAVLSFDRLHHATAGNNIVDETWNLVDQLIPAPAFWLTWDRCYRLRIGIAELFVKRELPPTKFIKLTSNKDLFNQLIEAVNKQWGGRNYLRLVLQTLRHDEGKDHDMKALAIESVLEARW